MSAGCEYIMCGTRGIGFVSTSDDVLEMSLGGVTCVCRVFEMCMCLARGGVVGVWR